jgi:hypothetical protein
MAQTLCTLDATGAHTILAGSYGSEVGDFSLFLQRTINPANATAISYSETKGGSVSGAGAMPAFTFAGTTGEKVQVRLAEVDNEIVPDVRIYRPDGSLLCETSSSTLAQELCTLDATGTHTILGGSFGSEVGDFSLFLQRTINPANAVAIAYGENKNGSVNNVGEMDAYTFAGTSGDQITVQVADVDNVLTPDVRVYRPDGSLLCEDSDSTLADLECTLDATGNHTILAGSYGSEIGAYTLSLAEQ